MKPEEWPIAAPSGDGRLLPARRAGSGRLATVRRDFFLDPDERLSEQERALMTAMLHGLIADLANEIRASLPAGLAVANDDDNPELVSELSAAGLLDDPALISVLLRRADEEQIAGGIRSRSGRRDGRVLQALVSHDDAAVSAAAMGLILARGRRRDRFGQVRLEFDDVPAEAALATVCAVAAGLRRRLLSTVEPVVADRELQAASDALLSRHDESRALEAQVAAFVSLLDEQGLLDEQIIADAADEGELLFVAAALARRAGVSGDQALGLLIEAADGRLMLLLRMAAASRELAARLLAGPGDLLGVFDPAAEIGRFDRLAQAEVDGARAWLRLNPAYRNALAMLGQDDGKRAL